jgi:DNA-directed RNA polymerase alpha subunit
MKLITKIEATLDLKEILSKSSGTITRHITLFVGADNADLPAIMQAVRDARDLLKNDADMTLRLIKVRPEREEEYKQAWATAAEKQLLNVYGLVKKSFDAAKRELTFEPDGVLVTAEEIHDWKSPVPQQEEHPGAPLIPDELPPKEVKPDPTPEAHTPAEVEEEEEEEEDLMIR